MAGREGKGPSEIPDIDDWGHIISHLQSRTNLHDSVQMESYEA